MEPKHTNRLSREKSPYLLQHAHNPVDWFPWGDEAFAKAAQEDKPVFLSVGYSTCHWCHVMERESFENEEVASLMNRAFVSIKVDREERPDIDSLYMNICTLLTGSGGWPLTVIMTPDKKPFFAATYIPRESKMGRTGMLDLIPAIERVWHQERQKAEHSSDKILEHLRKTAPVAGQGEITSGILDTAFRQFRSSFDPKQGGFGSAPKFPSAQNLLFLLRTWRRTGVRDGLHMVEKTLRSMRLGGIWDHIGFGFHRYSTDQHWLLPHFEKMLYDQAMLAMAYLEAYQATGTTEFARTAEETFTYVLRDLHAPEGAFYSAEDADSEGEEGKFYVWAVDEFRRVLHDLDVAKWEKILNVQEKGNFLEEATRVRTGTNILHSTKPLSEWAADLGEDPEALAGEWEEIRARLFQAREKRIRPLRDDKILTDWNGMMIAALASGGRILKKDQYTQAAREAADFLLQTMHRDGRLLHRYRDGEAAIQGHADDYAYLVWGLLELYQAGYDPADLAAAMKIQDHLDEEFWDDQQGGYFLTGVSGEKLPIRPKEIFDGPYPSANSVTLHNLFRLARLTGQPRWEERAQELMRCYSKTMVDQPAAYPHFLSGAGYGLTEPREVVVVGAETDPDTERILSVINQFYAPYQTTLLKSEKTREKLEELAPFTREMQALEEKATAYVCSGYTCQEPTSDPEKVEEMLA